MPDLEVADNEKGGFEVYRASKAPLNTLMRSFAARHSKDTRSLLLITPGWVRTNMGGPDARYSIEESIPRVVDTIIAQADKSGLQYLDQFGKTVVEFSGALHGEGCDPGIFPRSPATTAIPEETVLTCLNVAVGGNGFSISQF